jgi:hypothetical protein
MKPIMPRPLRCAIYTRKSTEHNLELAFNPPRLVNSTFGNGARQSPDRDFGEDIYNAAANTGATVSSSNWSATSAMTPKRRERRPSSPRLGKISKPPRLIAEPARQLRSKRHERPQEETCHGARRL